MIHVLSHAPAMSATATHAGIEQNAVEKLRSRDLYRTLLSKLLGGTVRLLILASAACIGGWLGIGSHGSNGGLPLTARPSRPVEMRPSACSGIEVTAASDIPTGYAFVAIRRIGDDCFALLKAEDTDASPAFELNRGAADVFGKDGRLMERFFAVARANGQSEFFEYRRLPVREMPPSTAAPR
jgi:hypothetical protein